MKLALALSHVVPLAGCSETPPTTLQAILPGLKQNAAQRDAMALFKRSESKGRSTGPLPCGSSTWGTTGRNMQLKMYFAATTAALQLNPA